MRAQYANTANPAENFTSLTDNQKSTRYYIDQPAAWILYISKTPEVLVKYTLTAPAGSPALNPRNWQLQASNDSLSWVTLDSRTGETFDSAGITKTYPITDTTAYRYFRLNITANNGGAGLQLAEIELLKNPQQQPAAEDPFDITDNKGVITAQYTNSSKPAENFPSLIDNKATTKYYISGKTALWVQYKSSVPAIAVSYTITSANDVATRDPKDWTFLGSTDGVNWVTLDTRSNETFTGRNQLRLFTFTNTTPYQYYRLNITANNGYAGTQFAEWEIFQRKKQTVSIGDIPEKTFGDAPFEVTATASSELETTLEVLSGPATFDGEMLTLTGAGTVTLRASQAGDDFYFPAADTVSFTVNKAAQTITFAPIPPKAVGEQTLLNASSSAGLPVAYAVVAGPGTIANGQLTGTAEGEVRILATAAGNENYLPADSVAQSVLIYGLDSKHDGIKIMVYPNPTHGLLKVKLDNKDDGKQYLMQLFDVNGFLVKSNMIRKNDKKFEIVLDISACQTGVYYLFVYDGVNKWVKLVTKY